MRILYFLLLLLGIGTASAQTITHGPIVGAVGTTSARVYVRTSAAAQCSVLVSTSASSFAGAAAVALTTESAKDFGAIADITGLTAATTYYYKVTSGGNDISSVQSFSTFPEPTANPDFTFAFGSCQKMNAGLPPDEPIYDQILAAHPSFFLQCGDWGYPDTTENAANRENVFSADANRVLAAYHARYSSPRFKSLAAATPLSYIWDDHDYINNNASGTTYSAQDAGGIYYEQTFPPQARANTINLYQQHFPHYPLTSNAAQGAYHSIRYGSAEVFVTDNRADRSPNYNCLVRSADTVYSYQEPAGHTILGTEQKQWLEQGIRNSSAKWIFVVGGVAFNMGYRKLISTMSGNAELQKFSSPLLPAGRSPMDMLDGTVDTWSGFQTDQNWLKALSDEMRAQGKILVFLSSDSHTSAIDDGTNSGIPELMSGNLAIDNSKLAQMMKDAPTLLAVLGLNITVDLNVWNAGGQGLGNSNFNHAYGKLEVHGRDSLRMSIVDVNGETVAWLVLGPNGERQASGVTGIDSPVNIGNVYTLYPNPATTSVTLRVNEPALLQGGATLQVYNTAGLLVYTHTGQVPAAAGASITIPTPQLPAGMYYTVVRTSRGLLTKSFQVQR